MVLSARILQDIAGYQDVVIERRRVLVYSGWQAVQASQASCCSRHGKFLDKYVMESVMSLQKAKPVCVVYHSNKLTHPPLSV